MKTPCIGCGRGVPVGSGGRCGRCRLEPKRQRSTAAWTARSRQLRAPGVCARCGRYVGAAALEAHHVDELARGGALMGPAVPLCRDCHRAVHA